jgi:hypothetical protein
MNPHPSDRHAHAVSAESQGDVRADHAQRRRRARRTALLHGLIAFGFFVAVIVQGIGAAH